MTRRLDLTDPYRVYMTTDPRHPAHEQLLCTGRTHGEALAHIVDMHARNITIGTWRLWRDLDQLAADPAMSHTALRDDPALHAIYQLGRSHQ